MSVKTANSVQQLVTGVNGAAINLGAATNGNRTIASAIAETGAQIAVGSTNVAFRMEDDAGAWKNGKCTISATGQVTQTSVANSSANGGEPTFSSSGRKLSLILDAGDIASLLTLADGVAVSALPTAGSLTDPDILTVSQNGSDYKVTFAALLTAIAARIGSTADTVKPVLSNPTGTQTGTTTATGAVTTDEGNGTLYCLTSTSATATDAAIKAGASQAVTSAGSKTFNDAGLTAGTTYYRHYLHRDQAGNDSLAAHSAAFTTASASGPTYQFNGNAYTPFPGPTSFGGQDVVAMGTDFYLRNMDGSAPVDADFDIYLTWATSATVLARPNDANHIGVAATYLAAQRFGNGTYGTGSLYARKTGSGGVMLRWLQTQVYAKGADPSTATPLWWGSFDGNHSGTPISVQMSA